MFCADSDFSPEDKEYKLYRFGFTNFRLIKEASAATYFLQKNQASDKNMAKFGRP
ncbi:MAG: hypothetical protein ACRYFL_03270 [Janthinobacterium lividum]